MKPVLGLFFAAWAGLAGAAPEGGVMDAMRDELQRSMQRLQLNQELRPYHIEYRLNFQESLSVAGTLGSLFSDELGSDYRESSFANVNVRVGNPELDSSRVSRFDGHGSRFLSPSAIKPPLDGNRNQLRRTFWLLTDHAYKRALEDYAAKKAARELLQEDSILLDQSDAETGSGSDEAGRIAIDRERASNLVRDLSALFRDHPAIEASVVRLAVANDRHYYLNSDGGQLYREQPTIMLAIAAAARAQDGAQVWDFQRRYYRSWEQMPDFAALKQSVLELARTLSGRIQAERIDNYLGPLLVVDSAAPQLFAQSFAYHLAPAPRIYGSDINFTDYMNEEVRKSSNFLRRINTRVLPRHLTVVDNPLLDRWQNMPLFGYATIDAEGVPTRRKLLVENGRLLDVLRTRAQVLPGLGSNGSARGYSVSPSNLIVTSSDGSSTRQLHRRAFELAKDYNQDYVIVVEKIANQWVQSLLARQTGARIWGRDQEVPEVISAYKLYPDGRRVAVRNLEIADLDKREFKNIAAVGSRLAAYTYPDHEMISLRQVYLGNYYQTSEYASLVTVVSGALLFEEVSMDDRKHLGRNPPLLESPLAARPADR